MARKLRAKTQNGENRADVRDIVPKALLREVFNNTGHWLALLGEEFVEEIWDVDLKEFLYLLSIRGKFVSCHTAHEIFTW